MLCRFLPAPRKAFVVLASLSLALFCQACGSSFNEDVFGDASQKGRIFPDPDIVLSSPSTEQPYYRTNQSLSIEISTPIHGAVIHYALVGVSDFQAYTGPVTVNYADNPEYDRRLLVYVTHPDYADSAISERAYLFLVNDGVITLAGGYEEGFQGDGAPATGAALSSPFSCVAVGDTVYLSDTDNHRIRRIGPDGVISTIAGTGIAGMDPSQEGGPATSAQLSSPRGLCVDASGNLFVADTGNHRIVRIDASGILTTVAGTGVSGYIPTDDGGPAEDALLSSPSGVFAASSGIVYIADTGNNRIRKISPAATAGDPDIISTVAGAGGAGYDPAEDGGSALLARLSSPEGVCMAASGAIYVADTGNNRVRKLTPGVGAGDPAIISTVAGTGEADYSGTDDGGAAANARLSGPTGVFLPSATVLLVADAGNNRVRRIALSAVIGEPDVITTIAGSGQDSGFAGDYGLATEAVFGAPCGVCVDGDGNILIADTDNNRIRAVIHY